MKLLINRNVVYTIIIVVGLLFGVGLFYLFSNFESIKDAVVGLFEKTPVAEQPKDEDIPYFADVDRDFMHGEDSDWFFKTFQPKILEYISRDGVHYMTVEYYSMNDGAKPIKLEVVLAKDSDWEIPDISEGDLADLKENGLSVHVNSKIRYSPNPTKVGEEVNGVVESTDQFISISEFKEIFKVGDRIALTLPYFYPSSEARTASYCEKAEMETHLCKYGRILDQLGADLQTLLMGNPIEEGSRLYPFSFSTELSLNEFKRNQ